MAARRGPGLPARRVPLGRERRPGGDDGRRRLLARLRRRRLARPLRRQLVVRARSGPLVDEEGGLPRNALFHNDDGTLRRRERRLGRRPGGAGQRLRRRRLRPRRAHRPLRHDRLERRPALERGRRHGSPRARRTRAPRAPGGWPGPRSATSNGDGWPDLFVAGYTDLNGEIPGATQGFPSTNLGVRDLLYLNEGPRPTAVGSRFREVGADAGLEVVAFEYGLGALLLRLRPRRRPRPLRRQRHQAEPALRQRAWPGGAGRRSRRARVPLRGAGRAGRRGRPQRGHGRGRGRLRRQRAARPVRHQRPRPGPRRLPGQEPTTVDPSFADVRADVGADLGESTGWGVSFADLDLDTRPRPGVRRTARSRSIDLAPTPSRSQVLENGGGGRDGRLDDMSAAVGLDDVGPLLARGSAAADFDNDGDLDIAVSSIGGPLVLLENRAGGGHWLEVGARGVPPGAPVTVDAGRTARRSSGRCTPAAATCPRRIPGPTSASATRPRSTSSSCSWPGGEETPPRRRRRRPRIEVEEPRDARPLGRRARASAAVAVLALVAARARRARPIGRGSATPTSSRTARGPTSRAGRSPGCGTRPCSTPSAATRPRRPCTPATCSTRRPPCGTRGPRTTRRPTATSSTEKHEADDVAAAREAAISYAAYRRAPLALLASRRPAGDLRRARRRRMESLCYSIDFVDDRGRLAGGPRQPHRRRRDRVRRATTARSSELRYVDTDYQPVNKPLVVAEPGADMLDPEPLAAARAGPARRPERPADPGQRAALHRPALGPRRRRSRCRRRPTGLPIDPGPPPLLGETTDAAYKQAAVDVIRMSSELDAADGVMIDIEPGRDRRQLARHQRRRRLRGEPGDGRALRARTRCCAATSAACSPSSGPTARRPRRRRATGTRSPTRCPTRPGFERRIGGDGPELDRLEWDVKLYFALNGAVHDAAVAAWGVKGHYDSVRPISMIRYMGGKGQSSDPAGPSYDPDGLPLVPRPRRGGHRRVERAGPAPRGTSPTTSARSPSGRGRATPRTPRPRPAGVGWILAVDWVPLPAARRSSPRPSPATCRATARSAAPPPR